MRVANHAKQTVVFVFTIDGEFGIENFVPAVLTVGLRKHHQFNIRGIASKLLERHQQIINFIFCQRQAERLVGFDECLTSPLQYIDMQ